MSETKSSTPSPTQSPGSPKHSIRVLQTKGPDDTTIQVKVGDNKVAVEVDKIESRLQNGDVTENGEVEDIPPITDEEVEEIIDKCAKMSKDDLKRYMDFFWSVDTFKFGAFTIHQLAYRLRSAGHCLENKEIARMFSDLDKNNDRLVTLDEYLEEMGKPKPKPKSKEEMKQWFETFDQDKDGYVNRADVYATMEARGIVMLSPQLDELMRNDSSGRNEKLNFKDFCFAINRL